jgi:pimeloyl-ACP methyl ester carboxylesterase
MTTFVLVHGFACDHTDWRHQIDHLKKSHTVYSPDLRGHGATPGTADEVSIETFGADIAKLLEEKNLRGAVLVGHSMGCRVVLEAARLAPARVGALGLIDGSWLGPSHPVKLEAGEFAGFARKLFDGMFLAPSELATEVIERAVKLPERVGAALFPRMVRWDAEHCAAALAAVRVPMLVLQTTYLNAERKRAPMQPGVTTPWLDLVRQKAPRARIEIIPGVGHFPQLEVPAQVNKLVSALV